MKLDLSLDPAQQEQLNRIEAKMDQILRWFDLLAPGMTTDEAANALGLDDSSVRRLGGSNKIRRYYEGKRMMIPVSAVADEKERRIKKSGRKAA